MGPVKPGDPMVDNLRRADDDDLFAVFDDQEEGEKYGDVERWPCRTIH